MKRKYVSDVAFSPAVKAEQERRGSRKTYARVEERGSWSSAVTRDLREFLAERDSFYFGTASADGQPYIQHRGGPRGFLTVLDDRTLAFADFRGNKQYITAGTLSENDKAFIFLMDYPNRRRIKLWGSAKVVNDDPELLEKLTDPAYRGRPEHAIVFTIDAWDINCPQHIKPRFTTEEIDSIGRAGVGSAGRNTRVICPSRGQSPEDASFCDERAAASPGGTSR